MPLIVYLLSQLTNSVRFLSEINFLQCRQMIKRQQIIRKLFIDQVITVVIRDPLLTFVGNAMERSYISIAESN